GALAALEERARSFEIAFPRELEAKLHEQRRVLDRRARRRNQIILGVVGGTTLFLITVAAWTNAGQERERNVRQTAARIESLLEEGRIEEARTVLEKLETTYRDVRRDDA